MGLEGHPKPGFQWVPPESSLGPSPGTTWSLNTRKEPGDAPEDAFHQWGWITLQNLESGPIPEESWVFKGLGYVRDWDVSETGVRAPRVCALRPAHVNIERRYVYELEQYDIDFQKKTNLDFRFYCFGKSISYFPSSYTFRPSLLTSNNRKTKTANTI